MRGGAGGGVRSLVLEWGCSSTKLLDGHKRNTMEACSRQSIPEKPSV